MAIDIEEKVETGWIHYKMILEVQGNDKGHIKKAIKLLTDNLNKEKGTVILKKKIAKPEELKEEWFSIFADLELLSKGYENLSKVCVQFSPSSLEILAPAEITMKAIELQTAMLDMAGMIATLAHAAYMAKSRALQEATQD